MRRIDLEEGELVAAFDGREVSYGFGELDELVLAYATTIHKSQGSEYDRAAVLLPPDSENRILSRQLLYTAVSRARHGVELWAAPAALETALRRPIARQGGLRERLLTQQG